MKFKILLISPQPSLVAPFKAALETNGFSASVADLPASKDRVPKKDQFDLAITLWATGRRDEKAIDAVYDRSSIDSSFSDQKNQPVPRYAGFDHRSDRRRQGSGCQLVAHHYIITFYSLRIS